MRHLVACLLLALVARRLITRIRLLVSYLSTYSNKIFFDVAVGVWSFRNCQIRVTAHYTGQLMKSEPPTIFTKARQSTRALMADCSILVHLSGSKEGRKKRGVLSSSK